MHNSQTAAKPMMAISLSRFLTSLSLSVPLPAPTADAIRESLQRNADKWFHWLLVSSVVVAVGVAFEAPESTIAIKRWYRLKRKRDTPPANETSFAIPASYLGLILVIAGVVGEGVFEGLLSNADTALRWHDDQILADTQQKAGDAKAAADAAVADAKQLTTDLATATSELKKANEGDKKAEDDAGAANTKAAALDLKAEELRKANDELEKDLSPRIFRNQPQAIKALREFLGTTVRLKYLLDPEAVRTAEQINFVLNQAGWIVIPEPASSVDAGVIPMGDAEAFFDGVTVARGELLPKESDELAAHRGEVLLTTLNNSGIEAFLVPKPAFFTRQTEIWVGLKPNPAFESLENPSQRGQAPTSILPSGQRLHLPTHVP
jgi:hypothetical protein